MKTFEEKLRAFPKPYVTDADLKVILEGTADSRYGKVKRMLAQKKLLKIRRGLYCIADFISGSKPHSFELAQYIYGPSYISLESALGYYGLIPEAVYSVTSICNKRSKQFETSLGIFSYQQVQFDSLFTEVALIKKNSYSFFIAKPWKAICDFIFCYRKDWKNLTPLIKSLRLNIDNLPILHNEELHLLDDYYRHRKISLFLKGVLKEWALSYER